eukprot:6193385-Pleurochrysis_carterae.AAC.1
MRIIADAGQAGSNGRDHEKSGQTRVQLFLSPPKHLFCNQLINMACEEPLSLHASYTSSETPP